MNTALLHEIADAIEASPGDFSQATYGRRTRKTCSTPCCIAGHAVMLSGNKPDLLATREAACMALGLELEHTKRLFAVEWPRTWFGRKPSEKQESAERVGYYIPNAKQAARFLRRLADGKESL